MRLEYREDPREWRKFTLLTLPPPWLLSGYGAWRGWIPWGLWVGITLILGGVAVVACVRPERFRGYYRAGVWVGFQVARALGYAVLTMIFWLVVVPMGWLLRRQGRDLLRLRRDAGASSYWHKSPPPTSLERMF
ncbi:MAG: hypothetical protein WHT82_09670 [Limisphaera sp.]